MEQNYTNLNSLSLGVYFYLKIVLRRITTAYFLLFSVVLFCQIQNVVEKFDLPSLVLETSGLLFLNGKLITHNDSGDNANLYEIDTITGNITRTISVTNATNIDWEDITQDDTYIYIGDIGNNNGTRTDLKIYRILKSDFSSNTSITFESITFSYEDQTDFTSKPLNTNFDAEAISSYKDKLVIFTKNWVDNTVNAYTIPKTIGTHSAKKVSSYNSNGLITGSAYNALDDSFLLSGYTATLQPFLMYIKNNQPANDDFFSGTIERTDITSSIGQGSQIEGITTIDNKKYFLSREQVSTVVNSTSIVLLQKLYRFDNGSFVLSTDTFSFESIQLFPNPTENTIQFKNMDAQNFKHIDVFDVTGKVLLLETNITKNQISIAKLTTGIYFIRVFLKNNQVVTKKFIKI